MVLLWEIVAHLGSKAYLEEVDHWKVVHRVYGLPPNFLFTLHFQIYYMQGASCS